MAARKSAEGSTAATLVVDASVAMKWVLPESGSAQALSLLDRTLIAPDLIWLECGNVLWRRRRAGELSAGDCELALTALQAAPLATFAAKALLTRAAELAALLDHPVYDCAYLALAERERADLITADRRFHDKVRLMAGRGGQAVVYLLDKLNT